MSHLGFFLFDAKTLFIFARLSTFSNWYTSHVLLSLISVVLYLCGSVWCCAAWKRWTGKRCFTLPHPLRAEQMTFPFTHSVFLCPPPLRLSHSQTIPLDWRSSWHVVALWRITGVLLEATAKREMLWHYVKCMILWNHISWHWGESCIWGICSPVLWVSIHWAHKTFIKKVVQAYNLCS